MDFIERIFGVSPDGGTGSTELMIVAVVVLLVILVRGRQWVATRHHGWERVVQAFALDQLHRLTVYGLSGRRKCRAFSTSGSWLYPVTHSGVIL